MKRFLYTLLALFLFVSMGLTQDTRNIAPREPSGADIGRIDKPWAVGYFDDVVLSNIPLSKLDRTLTLTNMSLQMGYNDSVMVPGEVCGIYHTGKVQVDNVLNLNTNAQDRITYESWKGNVNSITVPHWRPVYNGILNAPLHPFITNGGAYMVMGETNRWITAVDETGVNVSFEPPIPQSDYDYGPDVYIPDYGEEPPSPLHLSPISPTIASHDTTNFITTFEWESYLPDTTNYLFYLGSTYTNLSQIASTTNTSLTVNLLDYTDYVNQTTFWKVEAQAVPGVATGEVWYFYQHLNFIYPIDDVRGVELREDGLYGGYLTSDYATPQPLTSAGWRYWRGVSSHDGVTVYGAVDNNYIYKSTDGGETWTALESAGSRQWFDVSSHDGVTVYGAAFNNYIYKSTDGGETWTALTSAGSRYWYGVSSHDGVTVYGAVGDNYIYKSIGWIDNSLLNKSYTIIIQPTTNAINKLQDIHIGENNNFIYYMLNTKTNEWSIYDTYHKWRTVVSKIGDDWYYRNTNNVMEPSYTNEISTISVAINNNRYNRQRYFAYSGYLDYEHVEPLRISATFYNQATNQAPVLNAINLSTLSYPNEYKSNLSNYEITINSANSTNSIVKKLSPGTNNVIISYYQMLKDTE